MQSLPLLRRTGASHQRTTKANRAMTFAIPALIVLLFVFTQAMNCATAISESIYTLIFLVGGAVTILSRGNEIARV